MNSDYLTTREIKKKYDISPQYIIRHCRSGEIDDWQYNEGRNPAYYISETAILNYIENNDVPVGSYGDIPYGCYELIKGYDCQYAVEIKTGIIANFSRKCVLKPSPNRLGEKGYYQVFLQKDGKGKSVLVSHIVAEATQPNKRGCDNVHHINGNTVDNRPENLLYCFGGSEHRKLDKLMNAAKNEVKDRIAKKAYEIEIRRIQKLNKEDLFKIPHPDYENTVNMTYWMQLNKKGYMAYKKSGIILADCIRGELAEIRKEETIGGIQE